MCQILCRIHRQKNHASGKSGKEDRTVYDCQSSHRGGRDSILQDAAFQSDSQIARRRWLRKIHYQIMVMDFSGICCLDFCIILFGALGYCFVRALYWHNTMSWQYYNMGVLCYCNIMLLRHYVVVLLCYQGITLLQYHNRAYFIYMPIINTLQSLLSSKYNFTITIYILLYDTDWYVISVNQDAIVQYSIKLSILNI